MKRFAAILLAAAMAFSLCACGGNTYGVKAIQTLEEQEYSIAFRTDDPKSEYIIAAIEELCAAGRVDELSIKWFGKKQIELPSKANALEGMEIPEDMYFRIGVDKNSFPFSYVMNGGYWGYDIELASEVADRLGWRLEIQAIEKENVYVELSSGNIDCAWGGIAVDQKEFDEGRLAQVGPYIHNDIVIAARDSSAVWNELRLSGRTLCMPSTVEAMEALKSDEKLSRRLGQITRLAGGTIECFDYLYSGKCDVLLTDSTALDYYNGR